MQIQSQVATLENPFAAAREQFERLVEQLGGRKAKAMTHSEIESLISEEGNEVMRRLFQGHLDARGCGESAEEVEGADGVRRPYARLMERRLKTVFGLVTVSRMTYSAHETPYLAPRDAELNLPPELYSHGLQRRVATEVSKVSFDASVEAIAETTGTTVPKRQVEQLAARAASDFDDFYGERRVQTVREADKASDILALSADGKGVVMRREALREATRKAAEARTHKIATRLSKGEKRNAKRMATVAAVWTVAAFKRTPEDVMKDLAHVRDTAVARPRPENKRVWASLEKPPHDVIEEAFQEALRRDPRRNKRWIGLVDGNPTQIELLHAGAERHGVDLTIILDLMHVAEYVWKAAFVLNDEGTPAAEKWVSARLFEILRGHSSDVAAGMRRSATLRNIAPDKRKAVDACADYLINHRQYLRYDEYLAAGYPICTGVIEGTCRHLINDRLDIVGAHWGLKSAEAVLRLRAIRASGDFDEYWAFHEKHEWMRHHLDHYAGLPPRTVAPNVRAPRHLSIVK
jgi:hypothetical protein